MNIINEEEIKNNLTYLFHSILQGLRGGKTSFFTTPSFDAVNNFYVLFNPKKNFIVFEKKINGKGINRCEEEIEYYINTKLKSKKNIKLKESNDLNKMIKSIYDRLQEYEFESPLLKYYDDSDDEEKFSDYIENLAENNIELKKNILSIKLYNAFYNSIINGKDWVKLPEIAKNTIYRSTKYNKLYTGKVKFNPYIAEKVKYMDEKTHKLILEIVKPTRVVFYMTPEQYEISKKGGFFEQLINTLSNDLYSNLGRAIYKG